MDLSIQLSAGIEGFHVRDVAGSEGRATMKDPEESVASFTRDEWNRHWDDYAQASTENPAQNYRRELIFSLLGLHNSGLGVRLLDIGSGQGDMAEAVHAKFPSAEILGLELTQSGVEFSRSASTSCTFC